MVRPTCLSLVLVAVGVVIAAAQSPGSNPSGTTNPANRQAGVRGQAGGEQPGQFNPGTNRRVSGANQQGTAGTNGAFRPTGAIGDRQLAHWLVVENRNEIALAQFAQQKAQSDDVKQFAKQLIDDHQKMLSSLQQIDGNQGVQNQNEAAGGANAGGRRASIQPGGNGRQAVQQGGGVGFVALIDELGRQCAQSSQQELSGKSGAEFDKCYIGQQIGAHMKTLDTLKVFRNHASGQLQSVIDEGQPVVQSHLEHAKELMRKLDSNASQAERNDSQRR